jgi:hypothetical protein
MRLILYTVYSIFDVWSLSLTQHSTQTMSPELGGDVSSLSEISMYDILFQNDRSGTMMVSFPRCQQYIMVVHPGHPTVQ